MEKKLLEEVRSNLNSIDAEINLSSRKIFLFGHCKATLDLIDILEERNLHASAILDNNKNKCGLEYKGVGVINPEDLPEFLGNKGEKGRIADDSYSIVLITSRFFASMYNQLRDIGYNGAIRKLIDYNSYAEYSLDEDTIARMTAREKHGEQLLSGLEEKHQGCFKVFCPFNALGDIYFMISYYPAFAKTRGIEKTVFCVADKSLADVIHMFDLGYSVEVYEQKDLDAIIQAALYTHDKNSFIAHQDRPYVVNLSKALYIKMIPLEQIYCCGVYGLPKDTVPAKPRADLDKYDELDRIPEGRAVVFSPYAKSVIAIDEAIWNGAVEYYISIGYKCYTNVIDDEKPLDGTEAISPSIIEMKSVVERAGTFIGIRSGMCDIVREAKAKKIALFPDYYYCDTKWKAIDIYYINQFDHNLVMDKEIEWAKL